MYISRIPRDCFEDELLPVLEIAGNVTEFRLLMDHEGSGDTRGYGFCVYSDKKSSELAVKELDGFQIRPGRLLSVTMSRDNRRLYLGGLPRHIT
ncbi:hypothetical protein, partial [Salmonella sp. s51228]|uniref:hypothetical protein n=1 Tax=Salmonella sp. s51228 TaxID=3159652 RepID=UPI0039811B4E